MQAGLRARGFGPHFCRWLAIPCEDASSRVTGEMTDRFKLMRSVRQGWPPGPSLFVLLADILVQLVKLESEIEGLCLPGDYMLRIMSFVDDNHFVCRTTLASLNACALLLELYEVVSGMVVGWEKRFTVRTGGVLTMLPGLLAAVYILQLGEVRKYLGLEHGPSAEDSRVGEQF